MARRKGRSITREDVIRAAIDCLDAEGESALGVNRVARQLGIKPPSLYNHIEGNDDLRRAVATEGWRQVLDHHRTRRELRDSRARIQGICGAFRDFATAHPAFFAITTTTQLDPEEPEARQVFTEIITLFGEAWGGRNLDQTTLLRAGVMIRAMIQGFIGMEHAHQFHDPSEADETFEWMVDRVMDGVTAFQLQRDGTAPR